ncbi:hypothetical protein P148_SR1C00001G0726 [candidate division SR1 bacterium RAAC1_SR1_1]|nr:hypothetical protein P148_SR1C00001G0726 [candidate division SR1 bacterium RAAC1_SR1_1]
MMEIVSQNLDKQEIVERVKNSTKGEMDKLLLSIIKEKLMQEKDQKKLYEFFTYIYDNLYHDIIFKKIPLSKAIVHLLESLSMPVYEPSVIDNFLTKLKSG